MKKRVRSVGSVAGELIKKSREAALAAVQVFNNPAIIFKSEIYVVLMVISWTYLLHAFYRKKGIDYRYYELVGKRKRYDKTSQGAYKHWELKRCLNHHACPIDKDVANNLRFIIGLRHEIEHQMTTRIDEFLSARFQACCLNYNELLKSQFGDEYGIDRHLSFSLQFASLTKEHLDILDGQDDLPKNIHAYVTSFDEGLSEQEFNHPHFAYRVLFVQKTANRKGQADQVVEFIKADSELAKGLNAQYALIKETEKKKYLPKQIVDLMQKSGYKAFTMHDHTKFWKKEDARNLSKGLGSMEVNTWYWYEQWVKLVEMYCKANSNKFA